MHVLYVAVLVPPVSNQSAFYSECLHQPTSLPAYQRLLMTCHVRPPRAVIHDTFTSFHRPLRPTPTPAFPTAGDVGERHQCRMCGGRGKREAAAATAVYLQEEVEDIRALAGRDDRHSAKLSSKGGSNKTVVPLDYALVLNFPLQGKNTALLFKFVDHMKGVQTIDLSESRLRATEIYRLALRLGQPGTVLSTVRLNKVSLGDVGCRAAAKLVKHHQSIRHLHLAWATVLGRWGKDKTGFAKLMTRITLAAQTGNGLISLDLSGNNIGRACRKITKADVKAAEERKKSLGAKVRTEADDETEADTETKGAGGAGSMEKLRGRAKLPPKLKERAKPRPLNFLEADEPAEEAKGGAEGVKDDRSPPPPGFLLGGKRGI
mmetsp:Transcript_93688/g.268117  ORF Transcript_93688/g.268117 Transcript_93688/m.268117 type:complete len:376 (+) Transcript_93688:175-1302(+)